MANERIWDLDRISEFWGKIKSHVSSSVSGKADKVSGAVSGNLAGLDSNGNLTDSGSKASDFLTQHQDISGKLDASAMGIVEDGDTATHTIAQGQYVIWQGALYTADAAIASGTTLAASGGNKNLTAVDNGGLNALNSNIEMLGSNLLNSNQTYQLPNDWKIAIIEVYVGGSAVTFTTIVVNNGRTKSVRFGNYEVGATSASTNASGAQVEITSSNIVSLIGVYWVGTNRLSDSVYSVKYFRMK